ncbi:MAG TPA: D-2-hydroxyacid dehydrogenase [Chryseosolibacter sp.]|nr:D-2-hydroxyacid dehydrogenase [Chryseosolibacter sp.]
MKIVVLDGYALNPGDLSWEGLGKFGELTVFDRTTPEEITHRATGADVLFTNKTPVRENLIDQLPQLKFIGVLATGYNIVDVTAASRRDIVVSNIPAYGSYSVAQLTFALLLELCHHVQRHSDSVREGKWTKASDWCYWDYPLVELAGKTMGIIGYGNIGQKVGAMAAAFGMRVIYTGRSLTADGAAAVGQRVGLEDLLPESDVVSIHCPLTPETNGLINAATLRRMKKTAFLLNTSRGPIIVDRDLAEALNDGIISGAGIDVLSAEPPPANNPLLAARNCVITPHIAWATREARSRLMKMAEENLAAFVSGAPINVVN